MPPSNIVRVANSTLFSTRVKLLKLSYSFFFDFDFDFYLFNPFFVLLNLLALYLSRMVI